MTHYVRIPDNDRLGMVLTGVLACSLLFACSRYSGNYVKNQDEALALVGSYRPGELTESTFLGDWPMLENRPGGKYEWAWGILKTSSNRVDGTETRSYWLGFFDSDVTTFTRDRGHVYAASDSTGSYVIEPQVETVVRENWVGRKMWRLDFRDSVLVALERAESP